MLALHGISKHRYIDIYTYMKMLFEWEGQIYPQAQSCSKEEYEEHGFATNYCQSFPSNFLILIGPSNVPPRR